MQWKLRSTKTKTKRNNFLLPCFDSTTSNRTKPTVVYIGRIAPPPAARPFEAATAIRRISHEAAFRIYIKTKKKTGEKQRKWEKLTMLQSLLTHSIAEHNSINPRLRSRLADPFAVETTTRIHFRAEFCLVSVLFLFFVFCFLFFGFVSFQHLVERGKWKTFAFPAV